MLVIFAPNDRLCDDAGALSVAAGGKRVTIGRV